MPPYLHWNQAPPKGQQVPEQDIPQHATKEHSPELQYTGCPKLLQTHWHLITQYWTLHCTPERRNPAQPTRTPTQASLTRKPWQATCTTRLTARKLHNKEKQQTAKIQKGHLIHHNLNKMKRQRNTQHVTQTRYILFRDWLAGWLWFQAESF